MIVTTKHTQSTRGIFESLLIKLILMSLSIFQSTDMCFLSNNIYDYFNVSQGKITIPGVDDGEECMLADVSLQEIFKSVLCQVTHHGCSLFRFLKTCRNSYVFHNSTFLHILNVSLGSQFKIKKFRMYSKISSYLNPPSKNCERLVTRKKSVKKSL